MAFLLGRGSAVEWLRQCKSPHQYKRYGIPSTALEASMTRLERHAKALSDLSVPLQLIVWRREDRRRTAISQSYALNTQDGLHPGFLVERGLFVSTPEFTFVQMASVLDEEKLLFLGCELCGRYGMAPELFLREQSCSAQLLRSQASALRRVHGYRRALGIATRVLDGAASPMEVALALIMCEPRDCGGYGLEGLRLNASIPVRGRARNLWVDDHITPDIVWEEGKAIIEYDSALHHTAAERIASDALRRDVLIEMGYRVITVTATHMGNFHDLERIASIVASRLGTSVKTTDEGELNRRVSFQVRMRRLATHSEDLLWFAR